MYMGYEDKADYRNILAVVAWHRLSPSVHMLSHCPLTCFHTSQKIIDKSKVFQYTVANGGSEPI